MTSNTDSSLLESACKSIQDCFASAPVIVLGSGHSCASCKKPLSDAHNYRFHVKEGGLRCNACHSGGFGSLPVSFGAIGTLLLGKELKSLRVLTEVRNMRI